MRGEQHESGRREMPFIGFISERELERRTSQRAAEQADSGMAISMPLFAGSPAIAPHPEGRATHEVSWGQAWQQGAAAPEARDAFTVMAQPVHSSSQHQCPGRNIPPKSPGAGPPSPSKNNVPRSPNTVARDSLRISDSPATANRRLRAAAQTLPRMPSLTEPAMAGGGDFHSLSAFNAAGSAHPAHQPPPPVSSALVSEYPHQAPSFLSKIGSANAEDLGRCGVGIFCDKERGSPTAIVREVSVRGSAAREGSIRSGDEVVSVDGNSIAQWSAATLRNALQVQKSLRLLDLLAPKPLHLLALLVH